MARERAISGLKFLLRTYNSAHTWPVYAPSTSCDSVGSREASEKPNAGECVSLLHRPTAMLFSPTTSAA